MGSYTSRPANSYISNDKPVDPYILSLFKEKSIEGIPTATEFDAMRNNANTVKMNATMEMYVKSLKSRMEGGYDFMLVNHDHVDYLKCLTTILEEKGFAVEIKCGNPYYTMRWTTSPPSYKEA